MGGGGAEKSLHLLQCGKQKKKKTKTRSLNFSLYASNRVQHTQALYAVDGNQKSTHSRMEMMSSLEKPVAKNTASGGRRQQPAAMATSCRA